MRNRVPALAVLLLIFITPYSSFAGGYSKSHQRIIIHKSKSEFQNSQLLQFTAGAFMPVNAGDFPGIQKFIDRNTIIKGYFAYNTEAEGVPNPFAPDPTVSLMYPAILSTYLLNNGKFKFPYRLDDPNAFVSDNDMTSGNPIDLFLVGGGLGGFFMKPEFLLNLEDADNTTLALTAPLVNLTDATTATANNSLALPTKIKLEDWDEGVTNRNLFFGFWKPGFNILTDTPIEGDYLLLFNYLVTDIDRVNLRGKHKLHRR